MAFIYVQFEGKKTFGGYLKIDNGRQISLKDGSIIPVEPGTHYLSFSSKSSLERGLSNASAALGDYKTAIRAERNSVDGNITETFNENDVMFFTVVSDAYNHILGQPTFNIRELSDEEIQSLTTQYEANLEIKNQEIAKAQKGIGVELVLCLFVGYLGAHKFYRKKIGMGLLYLFTMGLFGLGILVDLLCIIKIMLSKKNT